MSRDLPNRGTERSESEPMSEATITLTGSDTLVHLLGAQDRHLRQVRDALGVKVVVRDDEIRILGEEERVALATEVFVRLQGMARQQGPLTPDDVRHVLDVAQHGTEEDAERPIELLHPRRTVHPRTPGQSRYAQAIRENELVFCFGPAGSGKTYLAVAMAVNALRLETIKKIVLVRPAVEAGEKLGFLPGDIQTKVNPYLRPLLDALHDMIEYDQIRRYMDNDLIEIIPLAYMRGRTLNESFIILDEGQNTTVPQMKMFLTRMGIGSRIIVTGDVTQVDLPPQTRSGLMDATQRLQKIQGVAVVELNARDIVRHRLVQDIVGAYDNEPKRR